MYLKKFLNQPNAVGSVLIALLFSAGVLFAFGFGGFTVQTEDLIIVSSATCGGDSCTCGYANCPGSGCSGCTSQDAPCGNTCGSCDCPDACSNLSGFFCWADLKNNVCKKNPPDEDE